MASFKKCIEEYCKVCSFDQFSAGSWRQQVEDCTVKTCKLYPVRPMTIATINSNRNKRGDGDQNETDDDTDPETTAQSA